MAENVFFKTNDYRKETLVLFATDSLANPRIWNVHNADKEMESFAVDLVETYPYQVKKMLEKKYDDPEFLVNVYANRGTGWGMGTVRAKDFFHFYFPRGKGADVTIFQFGISECWLKDDGNSRVSIEDFTKNIKQIISDKAAHDPDSPTIFVTIMPTSKKYMEREPKQNVVIAEWKQVIRENMIDNCYLADVEAFCKENEDVKEKIVHPDGHHLSKEGHKVFAQIIFDTINQINNK